MKLRRIIALGAAAVSALLIATSCHNAPNIIGPRAVRIHGPIHTAGGRIIDSTGHVVPFNGVNVRNFVSDVGSTRCVPPRPSEVAANLAAWGFNSVRLPLAWSNIEPQPPVVQPDGTVVHRWNEAYLASLDAFINDVTGRGLAVILGGMHFRYSLAPRGACHAASQPSWVDPAPSTDPTAAAQARCDFLKGTTVTGPAGNTWDGFTAVWTMLAKRYASNPQVVAIDMVNEPFPAKVCPPSEERIGDLYQQIVAAVKQVNPSMAFVAEDSPPPLALAGTFVVNPPLRLDNTIYSYHLYQPNWQPKGASVNAAYWQRARVWGAPMLVGEFNAFGYAAHTAGSDPNWASDTTAALSTWRREGVSWIVSSYAGGNRIVDKGGAPRPDLISTFQQGFVSSGTRAGAPSSG